MKKVVGEQELREKFGHVTPAAKGLLVQSTFQIFDSLFPIL